MSIGTYIRVFVQEYTLIKQIYHRKGVYEPTGQLQQCANRGKASKSRCTESCLKKLKT